MLKVGKKIHEPGNSTFVNAIAPGIGFGQQTSSWGTSVASAQAPTPQQQTALATVHTHLSGRYKIVTIIALNFAVLGAVAGLMLFQAGYQSVGLIEIQPVIRNDSDFDHIMPLYQQYVLTAVNTLHSEKVIREAMKSAEWRKYRPAPPLIPILTIGTRTCSRQNLFPIPAIRH